MRKEKQATPHQSLRGKLHLIPKAAQSTQTFSNLPRAKRDYVQAFSGKVCRLSCFRIKMMFMVQSKSGQFYPGQLAKQVSNPVLGYKAPLLEAESKASILLCSTGSSLCFLQEVKGSVPTTPDPH